MTRVHAFADDALGNDDAVGLVSRLRAGSVSAAELVEAAVARVEVLQPQLNPVAYQAFDRALAEARQPRAGFFSGVPTFVKDNSDVVGMPTQQGTRSFHARPAKADGDFARMYLGLGLVTLGKTQLSEFGFSASAEYPADWGWEPVRNPWDPSRTSGASSAGSAALVAAGAVPIAHANDGGGSIRIPAACCGLVGLKPTRGRIPSDKTNREMPVRIVHDGAVTRSVRDTAAFLRESERIYRDLRLPPVGDVTGPSPKRLRIGVVTDSLGSRTTSPDCLRVVEETAALLSDAGHDVRPAGVPVDEGFAEDFALYWSMLAAFLCDTGKATLGRDFDRKGTDNLTRGLARMTHRHPHRLPGAIRRLRRTTRQSAAYFADNGLDVVLSPVLAEPPLPLGELRPDQSFEDVFGRLLEWVTFTPLHNATGDPAMSLPLGTSSDGLPVGVMISSGYGTDARLLGLAYELEQLRPFASIRH